MTKKQTEVNDQNAEIAAAEATAPPVTPETETVEAPEEAEDAVNGEDTMNEALEEESTEEEAPSLNLDAKAVLEAEYPVLRDHGTHNAAVTGLQTSPGYDPSKL